MVCSKIFPQHLHGKVKENCGKLQSGYGYVISDMELQLRISKEQSRIAKCYTTLLRDIAVKGL
jgi:hypothetical protein